MNVVNVGTMCESTHHKGKPGAKGCNYEQRDLRKPEPMENLSVLFHFSLSPIHSSYTLVVKTEGPLLRRYENLNC